MEKLSKSLEKYLLSIYELSLKQEKIYPKDVVELVGYNKASTLDGIKGLHKRGYVIYKAYKGLQITKKGIKYSKELIEKRKMVSNFLSKFLLVEEENLETALDSIEHYLNDYLLNRFSSFLDFSGFCPCSSPSWIAGFKNYLNNGEMTDKCALCIENFSKNGKEKKCSGCNN